MKSQGKDKKRWSLFAVVALTFLLMSGCANSKGVTIPILDRPEKPQLDLYIIDSTHLCFNPRDFNKLDDYYFNVDTYSMKWEAAAKRINDN